MDNEKFSRLNLNYILSKIIRVITIAPVNALILLMILYKNKPDYFHKASELLICILCICIIPTISYAIQKIVPVYKKEGRKAQRSLAIVAANIGYALGILCAVLMDFTKELSFVCVTYFFCGVAIVLFNNVLDVKASGHACGVAGPVLSLIFFFGLRAVWGILVIFIVYISSLYMKRHTLSELVIGSLIPLGAMGLAYVVLYIFL